MRPLICIDTDGTLLKAGEGDSVSLNTPVFLLIVALRNLEIADLVLWSGGGATYAEMVARRTGTHTLFDGFGLKGDHWNKRRPDITLDDQEFTKGWVNLRLLGDHPHQPWMGLGLGGGNL